jgi:hypothetical protein
MYIFSLPPYFRYHILVIRVCLICTGQQCILRWDRKLLPCAEAGKYRTIARIVSHFKWRV